MLWMLYQTYSSAIPVSLACWSTKYRALRGQEEFRRRGKAYRSLAIRATKKWVLNNTQIQTDCGDQVFDHLYEILHQIPGNKGISYRVADI